MATSRDFELEFETREYIDNDIAKFWSSSNIKSEVNLKKSNFKEKSIVLDSGNYVEGELYCDYLLFNDDGFPIAIVEAKRFSKNSELGRNQSIMYADEIEKQMGYRPFIFMTNSKTWKIIEPEFQVESVVKNIFSKESIVRKLNLISEKISLSGVIVNKNIVDRPKSKEVILKIVENIAKGHQLSLIDMATGTGKTRVAAGLIELLIRKKKVSNVLFVVDRDSLRSQGIDDLNEFLNGVVKFSSSSSKNGIFVESIQKFLAKSKDKDKHKVFENLDSGFFDLIIFDECHRSLYNEGRKFFDYFNCKKVGLSATPKGENINKNTFELFDCPNGKATASYSFDEAVELETLVNFKTEVIETAVLKDGVSGNKMSEQEKDKFRKMEMDPTCMDYSGSQHAKIYMNKPTIDLIIHNFMDRCYKDDLGIVCKSILFCVKIEHCEAVKKRFDELYPEVSKYIRVIHSKGDHKSSAMVKEFKIRPDIRIAISVGVLDTGVNIPEICNLVFLTPVFSKTRLWQMIGRGTRNDKACKLKSILPNGEKKDFKIFDLKIDGFSTIENLKEVSKGEDKFVSKFETILKRRCDLFKEVRDDKQKEVFVNKIYDYFKNVKTDSYCFREHRDIVSDIQSNKFNVEKYIDEIVESMLSDFSGVEVFEEVNVVNFVNLVEKLFVYYYRDDFDKFKKISREIIGIASILYDLQDMIDNFSQYREFLEELVAGDWVNSLTFDFIEKIVRTLSPIMKYYRKPSSEVLEFNVADSIIGRNNFENEISDSKFVEFLKGCLVCERIVSSGVVCGKDILEIEDYFIGSEFEREFKEFSKYRKDFLTFLFKILNIKVDGETDEVVDFEFNNFLSSGFCDGMSSKQLDFLDKLRRVFMNKPVKYLDEVNLSDLKEQIFSNDRFMDYFSREEFVELFSKINEINFIEHKKVEN